MSYDPALTSVPKMLEDVYINSVSRNKVESPEDFITRRTMHELMPVNLGTQVTYEKNTSPSGHALTFLKGGVYTDEEARTKISNSYNKIDQQQKRENESLLEKIQRFEKEGYQREQHILDIVARYDALVQSHTHERTRLQYQLQQKDQEIINVRADAQNIIQHKKQKNQLLKRQNTYLNKSTHSRISAT